jgi:uncharacterized membrane protein
MNRTLAAALATAVVMLLLDIVWLGLVAQSMYRQGIGHLMAEQPRLAAAAVFYVVYVTGLMVFAVLPQADQPGWAGAALKGAMFGFFAYATYDLTNLATLKQWPVGLALIDIAWGTAISGASAGAGKAALAWAARA